MVLLHHKFVLLGQHLGVSAVKLMVPSIFLSAILVVVTIITVIFTTSMVMVTCSSVGSAAEIAHASNE